MRPVIVKAIDAGWVFKQDEGMKFLVALSESENMNYFTLDTVKLIVNY